MEKLLAKEAAVHWSADADINWDLPVRRPLWIRRKTYAKIISQFYHGEVVTQRLCRRLLSELPDAGDRAFITGQLADEEKHERVYRKYIARIGDIHPMDPVIETALEKSFSWTGSPLALIIAFHVIFEGNGVTIMEKLAKGFPCPLFKAINARIMVDEARHVAFGKLYMRRQLSAMADEERIDIYRWISAIWKECAVALEARQTLPIKLATKMSGDWPALSWERQRGQLEKIGSVSSDERQRLDGASA